MSGPERTDPILEYAPAQAEPRYLTLEERDGSVRVILPVLPTWWYLSQIVFSLLIGSFTIFVPIFWIRLFRLMGMLKQQMPAEFWIVTIEYAAGGLMWCASGAYEGWKYRRWGRVPRVLIADQQGLAISWLGVRRMRQRTWAADEITAIEFRLVKMNLNPWRTVGRLSIVRRTGRKKVFLLSSKDPQLPRRIAERVAAALHRSLKLVE